MFDVLFSLHFAAIALLVSLMTLLMAFICALLHKKLFHATAGEWLLEHVYCPLARVLLLMGMAFLMFPLLVQNTGYTELMNLFKRQDFLINMVNILFVSSLLLSFIPVLSHAAIALPILACMATALIFFHQVALPGGLDIDWLPSLGDSVRILILAILGHLFSRWSSQHVSLWMEYRFNVSRTRGLVLDIHYLILQMPILLAYGSSLHSAPGQMLQQG